MFKLAEVEFKGGNIHAEAMEAEGTFLYSLPVEEQLNRLKTNYKAIYARHPFERLLSAYGNKVSHIKERSFKNDMWPEIIKGGESGGEAEYGWTAKVAVEQEGLNQYNLLNKALDIEGFHVFVDYLIKRGPGGGNDGKVWETRQKHWRRIVDVCKDRCWHEPFFVLFQMLTPE